VALGVPPRFGVPHLSPASVEKRAGWQDSEELRVNNWLTPWDGEDPLDAGVIGLPYSGASINPSGAYAAPESVRLAFRYNTTYSPDWDTDIRGLRVTVAHAKIEAAVAAACAIEPRFVPVMIGGDHSVTAPAVRGFCAANPDKRVGIINIDAHLDVRNFEHGPHNGTPFRAILTGDLPIEGRNVVELGIHGFMNAANYIEWAREQGVTVISGRDVQRREMVDCIAEALRIAGDGTDLIYLSVDIDCLAFPWAIGTSATSPEGLSAWQLMEAVFACGLDPKVGAIDLVEIDPSRDVKDLTSRTGCSVLLTFFAGLYRRLYGDDGYRV
jgi:formiminoglutamase